jgi:hypothetical protein
MDVRTMDPLKKYGDELTIRMKYFRRLCYYIHQCSLREIKWNIDSSETVFRDHLVHILITYWVRPLIDPTYFSKLPRVTEDVLVVSGGG